MREIQFLHNHIILGNYFDIFYTNRMPKLNLFAVESNNQCCILNPLRDEVFMKGCINLLFDIFRETLRR